MPFFLYLFCLCKGVWTTLCLNCAIWINLLCLVLASLLIQTYPHHALILIPALSLPSKLSEPLKQHCFYWLTDFSVWSGAVKQNLLSRDGARKATKVMQSLNHKNDSGTIIVSRWKNDTVLKYVVYNLAINSGQNVENLKKKNYTCSMYDQNSKIQP